MSFEIIMMISGAILGWLGFLEKRLRDMALSFETRLNEKNEINQVVQRELKEDIKRLEDKIDMLLQVALLKINQQSKD